MYGSVREFFKKEYPQVAGFLDNPGGFWPEVLNNTISNEQLEANFKVIFIAGDMGMVSTASIALAMGRLTGKVPNPG